MLAMGRALMTQAEAADAGRAVHGPRPHPRGADLRHHPASCTLRARPILLVEQNAQAALSVADRAYVLGTGRITLSGTGKELMASDAVRKAYLGG